MWYRFILFVLSSGLFLTPLCQARVLLKMPVYVPLNLVGLGTTAVDLAREVEAASDGEIRIKVYGPGKLVPAEEIFNAVNRGQVQAGYITAGYQSGLVGSKAAFFSSIPFGPDAPEYLAWIYHGDGRKLWQAMYDEAGFEVHSIPCGMLAPETSGWFPRPIETPEDINGLRIRFFGLGALVMEKLGASTSLLAGAEIFPALEKGVIDATEFSMPAIDERLGLYKILKYNYFPGWHQQATILELLINGDVWNDKLSGWQRALMEMACKAAVLDSLALGEAIQLPVMKRNIEERGVENRYWTETMLQTFKDKWQEVVAEESAKDPGFQKIWDNLSAFRRDYETWNRWAFLPRPGTKRVQE